eukprot:31535-Pelagococcus_subviridis.AAC.2
MLNPGPPPRAFLFTTVFRFFPPPVPPPPARFSASRLFALSAARASVPPATDADGTLDRPRDASSSAFELEGAGASPETIRGHALSIACPIPDFIQSRTSGIKYRGSLLQTSISAARLATFRRLSAEGFAASLSRNSAIGADTAPDSSAAANAPQPPLSAVSGTACRGNSQRCLPCEGCANATTASRARTYRGAGSSNGDDSDVSAAASSTSHAASTTVAPMT